MDPEKRNSQGETEAVCFICSAIISTDGGFVKYYFCDNSEKPRINKKGLLYKKIACCLCKFNQNKTPILSHLKNSSGYANINRYYVKHTVF